MAMVVRSHQLEQSASRINPPYGEPHRQGRTVPPRFGLTETAESTLVARALPDELRGSGFGMLGAIQAAGAFASSAVVGLLYVVASPVIGFAHAAAWMAVAVVGSVALRIPRRDEDADSTH
jgi:hypothetical protein